MYVPLVGDRPCQNNGSCYDGYCSCQFGYSGKYCEIGGHISYLKRMYDVCIESCTVGDKSMYCSYT